MARAILAWARTQKAVQSLFRIAAGHPINRISELMPWVYKSPTTEAAG
jgi:hypothetical protein